MVEKLRTFSHS